MSSSRDAWQKLYSRHALQYGGLGDIRPLEPFLKPGMTALDAGCGDGKTTELMARKCEVVGSDFSREALVSLRSQRPSLISVDLVECELLSLPFDSEKFDAVACVHAVSHLLKKERSRVARELARVLKPDGHLLEGRLGRNFREGESFQFLAPAGCWFGAMVHAPRSYALVGCTVAPGFDFEDLELGVREELVRLYPQHRRLIENLTPANLLRSTEKDHTCQISP